MAYTGRRSFESAETTLAAYGSLTISHDVLPGVPVVTGWTAPAAAGTTLFLVHGATDIVDEMGATVTVTGATVSSGYSTPVGTGAILFSPEGDRIGIAKPSGTYASAWSLDFWFRPTDLGAQAGGRWVAADFANAGNNPCWGMRNASSGNGNLELYLSSNGSSWDIAGGTVIGALVVDTWYHIAIQWSGSHYSVYLNGARVAHISSSTALYASTSPVVMASHPSAAVGDAGSEGFMTEICLRSEVLGSGSTLTVPDERYTATLQRSGLAHGQDFSWSVNSTLTTTTITSLRAFELTGTWRILC